MINLHLQNFSGKSCKLRLNQGNLSPCLTVCLIHFNHVTYLTHQGTVYQSIQFVFHHPFVILDVFLSRFTCIYSMSTFFSRGTFFKTTGSHAQHTTWNRLILCIDRTKECDYKLGVACQKWEWKCSPHVL